MENKNICHAAFPCNLSPPLGYNLSFVSHLSWFGQPISCHFYEGKVVSAPQTSFARKALKPLKWIHVSGGETKHPRRVGPWPKLRHKCNVNKWQRLWFDYFDEHKCCGNCCNLSIGGGAYACLVASGVYSSNSFHHVVRLTGARGIRLSNISRLKLWQQ